MRVLVARLGALLALLAAAAAFSAVPVDEGDALVRLVSERLNHGQNWRQLGAANEKEDAVASLKPGARRLSMAGGFQVAVQPKPMAPIKPAAKMPPPKKMPPPPSALNRNKKKKQQQQAVMGLNKAKATTNSDADQLEGTTQKRCSWQAYVTEKMFNVAYPDLQAIYQVLVMHQIDDLRIFRIKGRFPTKGVRYFSFQSNNKEVGFPLGTIKDYEIEPDQGSGRNPYRTDSNEPVGTYTIHFTPRGDQGLANELALCPKEMPDAKCRDVVAVVLMRIYTSDPDKAPANAKTDPPPNQPNPRLFGYEQPPKVELRRAKTARKESWQTVPLCDQTRPTLITNMLGGYFSKLIPPFPDPPRYNRRDGLEMYLGEDTSNAGVFPNLDASYLLAASWQKPLPPNERIVAKVTGVLPSTARNFGSAPKIANYLEYDVRYASLSTIAMVEGGPTADTLDDAAFIRFYGDRPGWEMRREYTVVAAEDPENTCGLYNKDEHLFLSSKIDGAPQDYWGILYRQLVPRTARTHETDHSNGYARLACSKMADDNSACIKSSVLEGLMGDYYPHLEYYTCNELGELKPITNPDWFK